MATKTFFRNLILVITLAFASLSHATKVIQFSSAITGNGFNWSGTMGWLSENLSQVAKQARIYEATTGEETFIHITSTAGASSGAAISLLLDSAMNNPTLVREPGNLLIKADEAERVAEMIRFIGVGSDYQFWDGFKAVTSVFSDWTREAINKADSLVARPFSLARLANEIEDNKVPIRRGLYFASRKYAVQDFSRLFAFARYVSYKDIHVPVLDIPGYQKWLDRAVTSPVLQPIVKEVRFLADLSDLTSGDLKQAGKEIQKFVDWQKIEARKILLSKLHELDTAEILKGKIGNGIMTFALANLYDESELKNQKKSTPTFDKLRGVIFTNEHTAEAILRSPIYQANVVQGSSLFSHYIIAVVEDRETALNNSIQEPGLFKPLDERLESDALGISKIYIPERDSKRKFTLASTMNDSTRLHIVGGFPYQPIVSLMQPIYLDQVKHGLEDRDTKVRSVAFHFTLQNGWNPADPRQFPIQVVRKMFSGQYKKAPIDSNPFVHGFLSWNAAADKWQKDAITKINGFVYEGRLHWDLHLLPARLVGLGHKLALDGRKAAQTSLGKVGINLSLQKMPSETHFIKSSFETKLSCIQFYK